MTVTEQYVLQRNGLGEMSPAFSLNNKQKFHEATGITDNIESSAVSCRTASA